MYVKFYYTKIHSDTKLFSMPHAILHGCKKNLIEIKNNLDPESFRVFECFDINISNCNMEKRR